MSRLRLQHPAVTGIRREAARLCGIRQEPVESWIKDANDQIVPELELNTLLMAEAFVQLLATGLGALILVSASAVVLGGFSRKIKKEDFWYITAIGIIQTAKVVGSISGPTVRFFVQYPVASTHSSKWRVVGFVDEEVVASMVLSLLFAAAPLIISVTCFTLSIIGLIGAVHGSDIHTIRGNMKPALIVFYSLVLAQATLFYLWFFVLVLRSNKATELSHRYFGVGNTNGEEVVDRYITQTQDKCIEKGAFSTTNRTLVSFAAELLQSEHRSDHVSAVSVLRVLTTMKTRRAGAVQQICSSEQIVGNLFKLLRPKSPLDLKTKAETAEILTKLACNIRLTDIPGAAHSISSLLDPHPCLMKTAAKEGLPEPPAPGVIGIWIESCIRKCMRLGRLGADEAGAGPSSPEETENHHKPLIVYGLMILDRLASDQGNCTEICKTTDLVPKILAPLTHRLLNTIGNDTKTIVEASLRVMAKLVSGTCERSSKLRRELVSENDRAAGNIMWIMRNSSNQEMRILAVEILTRLTLGVKRMRRFIAYLKGLLFDPQHSPSPLRVSAGKALSALAVNRRNRNVIWEQIGDNFPSLVTDMNTDGNSTELRAVMAEFLAQICAKSKTNQRDRLISVSNTLSTVLEAIVITEIAEITERRKFLASFLGLAVQIREKLVTANDFANAVIRGLPMENNSFSENDLYFERNGQVCCRLVKLAKKLKAIVVEMKNESEDETCLVIAKAAAKLVTWTISTCRGYAHYLQQENIVEELNDIVQAMGDLERCVALRGDADEMGPYETFQTLVENVRNLMS